MSSHMESFVARLDRVANHMHYLADAKDAFIQKDPYKILPKTYRERDNNVVSYTIEVLKSPPLALSLIIADCINQLRSTLDNAMYRLGEIAQLSKGKLGELSFPVCSEPENWQSFCQRFLGLNPDALTVIESVQPYKYGNLQDAPLWRLNRLWNDDKHRAPILVGATLRKNPRLSFQGQRSSIEINYIHEGPIENGTEIVRCTIVGQQSEVNIQAVFDFNLAFDINGPAKGAIMGEQLLGFHNMVNYEVIAKLDPFLI